MSCCNCSIVLACVNVSRSFAPPMIPLVKVSACDLMMLKDKL